MFKKEYFHIRTSVPILVVPSSSVNKCYRIKGGDTVVVVHVVVVVAVVVTYKHVHPCLDMKCKFIRRVVVMEIKFLHLLQYCCNRTIM